MFWVALEIASTSSRSKIRRMSRRIDRPPAVGLGNARPAPSSRRSGSPRRPRRPPGPRGTCSPQPRPPSPITPTRIADWPQHARTAEPDSKNTRRRRGRSEHVGAWHRLRLRFVGLLSSNDWRAGRCGTRFGTPARSPQGFAAVRARSPRRRKPAKASSLEGRGDCSPAHETAVILNADPPRQSAWLLPASRGYRKVPG